MKVKAELSKASFLICLHHNKINDMAFADITCVVKHGKIRQVAKRETKGMA
jgi:ABC-type sugar transport system ATPase subunit